MVNCFLTMEDSATDSNSSYIQLDSGRIFQDYAKNLAKEGKFREALSVYSLCAKQTGPSMEVISDVGQLMVDSFSAQRKGRGMATDPWSCCFCAGVLVDPVTLNCGHSYCKKCILKDWRSRECVLEKDIPETCKKCGVKYKLKEHDPVNEFEYIKGSIIVNELVKKYWLKELKAVELRNEGNKLFLRGNAEESIKRYSEAYSLAENDHLLTSNRSHALYKLGDYQGALEDAERTIDNRPDFGKGYFRKGMAQEAKGQNCDALIAFFECLMFEEYVSKQLKGEIFRVLAKVVAEEMKEANSDADDMMTEPDLDTEMKKYSATVSENVIHKTEESERESVGKKGNANKFLIPRNKRLCRLVEDIEETVTRMSNLDFKPQNRDIDPNAVDSADFECSLCFRLLWEPVTTNCGHTYCRSCLDRSLDHRTECPLCKSPLELSLGKLGVNEFVDQTIRRMLPNEYLDRQRLHEDEIAEIAGTRKDGRTEIPVFICTMSFPNIPCPLHVFEPRYRLMIRRAMESGAREFGMCVNDTSKAFADFGTMLEIRDIQYFADGRSIVDTMGSRRFRVLERGTKDGYSTAVVEFLSDQIPVGEELEELRTLHDQTRSLAVGWFNDMDANHKINITSHYGPMPRVETEYWKSASGPAWAWWVLAILPLDNVLQQQILSQTQLRRRLEAIGRILRYMKNRGGVPL